MNVSPLGRRIASLAATGLVAVTALLAPPSGATTRIGSEDGTLSIPVTGEVELDRPDVSFPLPSGTRLEGALNSDFTVAGDLLVPGTGVPVRLLDFPRVGDTTAEVRVVGTAPTETVFAEDGTVTVVHSFRLEVPRLDPDEGSDQDLVKETCRSGEIIATLHGEGFDLFEPFPLEGTFAVPSFRGCGTSVFGLPGVRDLFMTELLAGSGTLRLTVGPFS